MRMPTLRRLHVPRGNRRHEAHVSTESPTASQDARLPRADEDEGRAEGSQTPAGEGAQTADRITGRFPRSERLTISAEIQALFQQGKRVDRPSFVVLWRETDGPRRAGFAVTRQIRGAVSRNRARRRLREAFRATRQAAPTGVALMMVAKRPVLDRSFPALLAELNDALGALARRTG